MIVTFVLEVINGLMAQNNRLIKRKRTKTINFIIIVFLLTLIGCVGMIKGKHLEVNHHDLVSEKIPEAFDNYKIVHLSDLHNETYGLHQQDLIEKILAEDPDLIVISGDSVDRYTGSWDNSLTVLSALAKVKPVYFSTGNHEYWSSIHKDAAAILAETGAIYLKNESINIEKNGEHLSLSGIDDPWYFHEKGGFKNMLLKMEQDLPEGFHILISHRPERQEQYVEAGFDLVFSGHAHGGQVRLPFTQGLIAPDQGFFPKLTSGLHEKNGKFLMISRGLGNPLKYPRFFNAPEIVVLTLKCKR